MSKEKVLETELEPGKFIFNAYGQMFKIEGRLEKWAGKIFCPLRDPWGFKTCGVFTPLKNGLVDMGIYLPKGPEKPLQKIPTETSFSS